MKTNILIGALVIAVAVCVLMWAYPTIDGDRAYDREIARQDF